MNNKVDKYLSQLNHWQDELTKLREIILDCGLTEDFKWMHPCYTLNGKNIALIHGFKDYCALLFNKGALLKDLEKILIQQTENTQYGRQIRFTNTKEIEVLKPIIKAYIFEAIEVEKLGLQVKKKKTSDYDVPEELKQKFKENSEFEKAFKALTGGRQRGYLLHFAKAKQAKTRQSRIEKHMERIFNGKGLHDCVCGLSKRMPNCDGSHKQLESTN
ncbi:DUF1801 domain-containing protein [Winogradskyella schleiferi]|uniref:DUF1801 domain-containing protein n=1 Tax=Winogradskyella schleiferi TaxID=2686078 RepID=UPI0015BC49E4|nr:DUF1801 domain-containing protein [Winogradskyella schleiferi]